MDNSKNTDPDNLKKKANKGNSRKNWEDREYLNSILK